MLVRNDTGSIRRAALATSSLGIACGISAGVVLPYAELKALSRLSIVIVKVERCLFSLVTFVYTGSLCVRVPTALIAKSFVVVFFITKCRIVDNLDRKYDA